MRLPLLIACSVLLMGSCICGQEPIKRAAIAPDSSLDNNKCSARAAAYFVDRCLAQDLRAPLKDLTASLCLEGCPSLAAFADGYASLQLDDLQKAELALRQADVQYDDKPYLEFVRGQLHFRHKELEWALSSWEPMTRQDIPCDLQVRLFNNLGTLQFSRSKYVEAAAYFERAHNAVCDCEWAAPITALVLQNIAMMHLANQHYPYAIRAYLDLLSDPSLLMNNIARSKAFSNLGSAYIRSGQYFEALESLEQSVALLDASKDPGPLSSSLYNLSLVYIQLGMERKSEEALNQAIALMKARNDQARLAKALGSLGLIAFHKGDNALAEQCYQDALDLSISRGDVTTQISTYNNLGGLYVELGQVEKAVQAFERVIEKSRELKDHYRTAVAQANLAGVLMKSGQAERALNLLQEAEGFAVESQSQGLKWNIAWLQGKALWEKGEREASLGRYREAIAILNDLRKSLKVEELQKSFAGQVVQVYEDYLEKLLLVFQANHDAATAETAFGAMEMKKAQILLEFLARAGVDRPRQADLGGIQPLRDYLAREKALFLSYSLGSEGSQLILVSPEGVEFHDLSSSPALASQVRAALQAIGDGATDRRRLAKLGALVAPVFEHKGVRKLIISPDGALHLLPFEALPTKDGRYLIEEYAVQYAPSASVFGELVSLPDTRGALLALGNPDFSASLPLKRILEERGATLSDLPFAREEVLRIAKLVPGGSQALTGAQASEASVKAHGGGGALGVLHFATHGIVDEITPQYSGLALSPGRGEDGYLTVQEILGLSLPCNLVTLSACDTGRGEIAKGEGVLGFGRAFLYAGARGVLVSLWKVNDLAASRLMESFYRELGRGAAPEEALRSAKLELLRHGIRLKLGEAKRLGDAGGANKGAVTVDASSPAYWAPFVLIGQ